jgi:glutamine cyclotransferase
MVRNFIYILILIVSASCFGGNSAQKQTETKSVINKNPIQKVLPSPRVANYPNSDVKFSFELERAAKPDSVVLYLNHKRIGVVATDTTIHLPKDCKMGQMPFYFEAYNNGVGQKKIGALTILPKEAPENYTIKIIKSYPHDENSYTQGLIYKDGKLFESTGLNGVSRLLLTDIESGKILKTRELSFEFFGEGIALTDDKIFMLTWENNKGFIFNAETFDKTGEFNYDGEGWGLTTDGKKLYQSDGSNRITVRSTENFKRESVIQVFDNNGPVIYLNELEWIENEIWANVYLSNKIVRIDPNTGKVNGVIDLDILTSKIRITEETDVMNGIAYDPQTKRIFVTGKKWNKLFQIEVVKQK